MSSQSPIYPYSYSQAAQLDPRITLARPPIDAALAPIVDAMPLPEELDIAFMRAFDLGVTIDTILEANPHITHAEHLVPKSSSDSVNLSIFSPTVSSGPLPVLFFIHGGGMISGDRLSAIPSLVDLVQEIKCVIASIEYRLSPETPAPGGAEDCYDGIVWLSTHAVSLGIDPAQIIICGSSGGAPLAAAACLMARDRQLPAVPIKAQMLLSPMLDDRCDSISDHQFEFGVPWNGLTNRTAWNHALAGQRGTENVSSYQVPARATDLSDLPQAYIDAAECEVFRDPAVVYAMNMWRCGSSCELHVWPGGVHLFDAVDNPDIPVVGAAIAAKRAWLRRMMKS
ncbi:lipase [Corynespora cassiicola Philippines]|uniref:Lipase n=1 Tax=Corynespora cassiicola Philippines TaxID=1448308 RepID=A0A2T2N0S6_CORCC|nr:lipase [Corynespora cassiicola Philippines]